LVNTLTETFICGFDKNLIMRWLIIALIVVFLVGCSNTQVVKLDNYDAPTPIVKVVEEDVETIVEEVKQPTNHLPKEKSNKKDTKEDEKEDEEQENIEEVNPEYDIINCCFNGLLEARVNSPENLYSETQIKNLMLNIYEDNCHKFPSGPKHNLYLSFEDKPNIFNRNHLSSFTNGNYNELVVKGKFLEADFENCLN